MWLCNPLDKETLLEVNSSFLTVHTLWRDFTLEMAFLYKWVTLLL
ncbi:hypothetical protein SLEP1_g1235 [Rubroshorea leprosula]|uniref:Uncharacterized protein n=1 Tax=Rubroshorea leprosula TaxID=152421 RepID=A0AAV5HMQ8_9ROSI|nr:hypothetical protein SLEP1_g1235 [Rubroshorea leprosula]